MNIKIITASAGSGKTTRLSKVLDEAISSGRVHPEGIVAATFTNQAAAELIKRARERLIANGRGRAAHQLLAARIGTVNSVCGSFVTEFAFELGLSPALRVLDDTTAEVEQKHVLGSVVSGSRSRELQWFKDRFDVNLDWQFEVRRLIDAARTNCLDEATLRACAERSVSTLDECLGACAPDGGALDRGLAAAITQARAAIDTTIDTTKGTAKYLELLDDVGRKLERQRMRWGDWVKVGSEVPTKKSLGAAAGVAAAAFRHIEHPRLREEMHRFIRLVFEVAADALVAYQAHKRERGVIDFVDQETLALTLLRRPEVRTALEGQLDLVLIDEFQDTSPLQLAIFLELAGLARESVWVGDPKQAIYGFRGTDPALMDAAIESLTSPTSDPDLIQTAVDTIGRAGAVETLSVSYRSRPGLVSLTSEIFARAFAHQGMPEERTRLTSALGIDPPGLGPIVEQWPLLPAGRSAGELAACVAEGVRELLARAPQVRDRESGQPRAARAGDIAVLCRTNAQCQLVSDALSTLGIASVVPRMGLLSTEESQVVLAGLALWVDPGDSLAAAKLARLTTYATDLDGLVARAISIGREAFAEDPLVAAIRAARKASPDLDVLGALDAVVDAVDLRGLCASWAGSPQRLANLDALRGHAAAYLADADAGRDAPSVVGLLAALGRLVDDGAWGSSRTDRQALLGSEDSVTVSTWHRAKGLEWPIAVLYGLESLRAPTAYGVHVLTEATRFDVAAPLAGRWIRFWPNPYLTSNQGGPVKTAYETSPTFAALLSRAERESLRVLYVGWTRARDRLILAAQKGKLLGGLLGTLRDIDPTLITDPDVEQRSDLDVTWAGQRLSLPVHPAGRGQPSPVAAVPGEVTLGRAGGRYPPARLSPSMAAPIKCTLGTPVVLGPRLTVRGRADMADVGQAVHGFLAADQVDLPAAERVAMAEGLLRRYGVQEHLDAADVVLAADRLWTWLDRTWDRPRLHREWPVSETLATGTLVAGTADLVARAKGGVAIIDHKTFPGTIEAALERLPKYSGQLATYAHVVGAALAAPKVSTWIHLPVLGIVAEVCCFPVI